MLTNDVTNQYLIFGNLVKWCVVILSLTQDLAGAVAFNKSIPQPGC